MRINLKPAPELVKKYGALAYISQQERQSILNAPYGRFKPFIKQLEKEIKFAKKHPQVNL